MFKKSLEDKLKRIFDFDAVEYDIPDEAQEQEKVFIQVDKCRSTIKEGIQIADVTGMIRVFANTDKLPYGYFHKRLRDAAISDTKDLFFYNFEENEGQFRNITERTFGFRYFYNSQYDPEMGTITSIETEVNES